MALTALEQLELIRATEHVAELGDLALAKSSVAASDLVPTGSPTFGPSTASNPPAIASGDVAILDDGDRLTFTDAVDDTLAFNRNLRAISFWFRFRTAPSSQKTLFVKRAGGIFNFQIEWLGNGSLFFRHVNANVAQAAGDLPGSSLTNWTHVTLTFEPGTDNPTNQTPGHTRMFVNGAFAAEQTGVTPQSGAYPLNQSIGNDPYIQGSSEVVEFAGFQVVTGDSSGTEAPAVLYDSNEYASWLYNAGESRTYADLVAALQAEVTAGELIAASATDSGQATIGSGAEITGVQSHVPQVLTPPPSMRKLSEGARGVPMVANSGRRWAALGTGSNGFYMAITDSKGENLTSVSLSLVTATADKSATTPQDFRDVLAGTAQEEDDATYYPYDGWVVCGPTENEPAFFGLMAAKRRYIGTGDRDDENNWEMDTVVFMYATVDSLASGRPTWTIRPSGADHNQPRANNQSHTNIGQQWCCTLNPGPAANTYLLCHCNYLFGGSAEPSLVGEVGSDIVNVAYLRFVDGAWVVSDQAEVSNGDDSRHTHNAIARVQADGRLRVTWSEGDGVERDPVTNDPVIDENGDPNVSAYMLTRVTNGTIDELFAPDNPARVAITPGWFRTTSDDPWNNVLPGSEGTGGWGPIQKVHGSPINSERERGLQPVGMAEAMVRGQQVVLGGADKQLPMVTTHDADGPFAVTAMDGYLPDWKACFEIQTLADGSTYASARPDTDEVTAESLFALDPSSGQFAFVINPAGARVDNFQAAPIGVPMIRDGVLSVIETPASFRRSRPFIADRARANVMRNATAESVPVGATVTEMTDAALAALGVERPPGFGPSVQVFRVQWPGDLARDIVELVGDSITLSGASSVTVATRNLFPQQTTIFNLRGYLDTGTQGTFGDWVDFNRNQANVQSWVTQSYLTDGSDADNFGGTGEPTFLLRSDDNTSLFEGDVLIVIGIQATSDTTAARVSDPGQIDAGVQATATVPVFTDGPSVVYAVASAGIPGSQIDSGDTLDIVTFTTDSSYITIKATADSLIVENSGTDVATITSFDGAAIDVWDGIPIRVALHYNGLGTEVWLSYGGRPFENVYTAAVPSEPEIDGVRAGGPASRAATQGPANLYAVAAQSGVYLVDGDEVRVWAHATEGRLASLSLGGRRSRIRDRKR